MNPIWLAGFMDGEGTIGLYDTGSRTGYKSVKVSVGQKNEEIIRAIHEVYPEGSVYYREAKEYWTWQATGAKGCEHILRDITPHLLLTRKKEAALAALSFIEDVNARKIVKASQRRSRDAAGKFVSERR